MALFDQSIVDTICNQIVQHHASTSTMLGLSKSDSELVVPSDAPLLQSLHMLVSIANGEQIRGEATKGYVQDVESALSRVQEALFSNAMQTRANLPDTFWQTDVGILLSRVRWWLSADELISISNAAALAFGENSQANRMRIVRAIDSGHLDWIPDPSVANRQQNRRVLRPQVERLAEQRRRPA